MVKVEDNDVVSVRGQLQTLRTLTDYAWQASSRADVACLFLLAGRLDRAQWIADFSKI